MNRYMKVTHAFKSQFLQSLVEQRFRGQLTEGDSFLHEKTVNPTQESQVSQVADEMRTCGTHYTGMIRDLMTIVDK